MTSADLPFSSIVTDKQIHLSFEEVSPKVDTMRVFMMRFATHEDSALPVRLFSSLAQECRAEHMVFSPAFLNLGAATPSGEFSGVLGIKKLSTINSDTQLESSDGPLTRARCISEGASVLENWGKRRCWEPRKNFRYFREPRSKKG